MNWSMMSWMILVFGLPQKDTDNVLLNMQIGVYKFAPKTEEKG